MILIFIRYFFNFKGGGATPKYARDYVNLYIKQHTFA